MDLSDLELSEIEVGHHFLTVYGGPHSKLLHLGNILYPKLPKELKSINREYMAHIPGDVPLFHPYGDPKELSRDPYTHFHVIYPRTPTTGDVHKLLQLINKCLDRDIMDIHISLLEDRKLIGIQDKIVLRESIELYNNYMRGL